MSPKYRIGDIVRLLPWDVFDEHLGIPTISWAELMDKDLKISKIQTDNQYQLILNGKQATCIYYNFHQKSFVWCEEFLTPTYSNFLKDKDFEI